MKFLAVVSLCVLSALTAHSQSSEDSFVPDPDKEKTAVPTLTLAREDPEGNIVENIAVFSPTDIPIICYVTLGSSDPVKVRLHFVAAKAVGLRPNSTIISIVYATKDEETNVTFTGRPEKRWAVGSYRVDLFISGKPAGSRKFKVEAK